MNYKQLIKRILKDGHSIMVSDDEGALEPFSTDYKAVIDAVESVEICELTLLHLKEITGWVSVLPFLDEDETINDYSESDYLKPLFDEAA